MAPTIHFVRHAQGFHNLSLENEKIHDPNLTPLGEEQCATLRAAFPHHDSITHLVASPMRRTLYTSILAFGADRLYPVIALDVLQELSDAPSDIGTDAAALKSEFGDKVDLASVRESWTDKSEKSPLEPVLEKLTARARDARRRLRVLAGDGDGHVVVVTHGGFAHFLTDDWLGIPSTSATGWANCEYRSYQFVDPTALDEDASMQETEESWRRRGGGEPAPTATERQRLRSMVQRRVVPNLKVKA